MNKNKNKEKFNKMSESDKLKQNVLENENFKLKIWFLKQLLFRVLLPTCTLFDINELLYNFILVMNFLCY